MTFDLNCPKFNVIISHPAKQQNIYERPLAAQKADIPVKFLTGLYYKPDSFPYRLLRFLPKSRRGSILEQLEKRRLSELDPNSVISLSGPWLEGALRPFRLYDQWSAVHDWLSSRWIHNLKVPPSTPTILHCFDGSSRWTIEAAREKGIITVLEDTIPVSASVILAAEHRRLGLPVKVASPPRRLLIEIKEADYLIAQSKFGVDTLIEYGVPSSRIIMLPMGVDTDKFYPSLANTSPRPFRVTFVGQLSIRKGLHHLLEAWSQLNLPEAELVLAGMPYDKYGQELLQKYDGSYRWLGFVPHSQLPKVYQESDIFVFPSLVEGGSNVLYEALASGLPCVVTTNAGSAVRDGIEGFVIPTGDVAALKDRISRLYNDRGLRKQMGAAARRQAERLTWEHFSRRLKLAYEHIIMSFSNREQFLDLTNH